MSHVNGDSGDAVDGSGVNTGRESRSAMSQAAVPPDDSQVIEALREYQTALESGLPVDRQEFLSRHTNVADALADCLDGLEFVRAAAPQLSDPGICESASQTSAASNLSSPLGDFRIIREIGRGGMGVVYEAEQMSLGRQVALKVLPLAGALDQRHLQRFKNEAQAAAQLHHTNIVPVYYVGSERGVHFYAMQFIEGQTLAQVIRELRGEAGERGCVSDPSKNEDQGLKVEDGGSKIEGGESKAGAKAGAKAKAGAMATALRGHACPPKAVGMAHLMHGEIEDQQSVTQDYQPPDVRTKSTIQARDTAHDTPRLNRQSSILYPQSSFFRTVAQLGIQAAEALDYAHQTGIIHRDIKPSNILIETAAFTSELPRAFSPLSTRFGGRGEGGEGGQLRLWITDFGLAQFQSGAELTMTGDLVGTLRYMSPEQALAKRVIVDHRTDIYSLGATLYELLTLRPPYEGNDRQELLRRIAFEEPKPLRRINPRIPAELETIVLKSLEKNPADRYATAKELADDLRRYLQHEPIRAMKPTWMQRAGKWSRRHPALVRSAVVMFFLITVGSVLSTWLIWKEKQRTSKAYEAEAAEHARAELERETAERVLRFVEDKIFSAARTKDLGGGLGYNVKLADAIKTALPFVGKNFSNQPLVEARLRTTMGISFLDLGDTSAAAEQFQIARALYTQHLGPDHIATLRSMGNLANSYTDAGRTQEALQLREETLQLFRASVGADHPETLKSMTNLAESYAAAGRIQDALELRQETLKRHNTKLGPDNTQTLHSMHNLALSYADFGRTQEAIQLLEETLKAFRLKLGPEHPDTVVYTNDLANSYSDANRIEEAVKLYQETLTLMKRNLGPNHPTTLKCMNNLAICFGKAGKSEKALSLHEETLRLMRDRLGPDHPDTLEIMGSVAMSYAGFGRTLEGVQLLEQTVKLQKDKLGKDHPRTLESMGNLAELLAAAGRNRDALQLREETFKRMKAKLGSEHPHTLGSMHNLANGYAAFGRFGEGLKLFDETLTAKKARLGPRHIDTLGCMVDMASVYVGMNKLTEAINLYQEALAVMKSDFPNHPFTLNCMEGLANSYAAFGRAEEALQLREETLKLRKAKLGFDHPATFSSMINLADSYAAVGRMEEAIQLCEKTLNLQKDKLGLNHPETLRSMNNLARYYNSAGRPQEALQLFEQAFKGQKANLGPGHSETLQSMNDLAWLLAACSDAKFRDPQRAVTLAKQGVALAPMNGAIWNTLGVAYYRSGEWNSAIQALNKSQELRNGGDCNDWFFLAMAHYQLQHQKEAREEFAKAVAWMDKHQPQDQELRRFRREAEELLGIKSPAAKEEKKESPQSHKEHKEEKK